jgi:hypothetical protein
MRKGNEENIYRYHLTFSFSLFSLCCLKYIKLKKVTVHAAILNDSLTASFSCAQTLDEKRKETKRLQKRQLFYTISK